MGRAGNFQTELGKFDETSTSDWRKKKHVRFQLSRRLSRKKKTEFDLGSTHETKAGASHDLTSWSSEQIQHIRHEAREATEPLPSGGVAADQPTSAESDEWVSFVRDRKDSARPRCKTTLLYAPAK